MTYRVSNIMNRDVVSIESSRTLQELETLIAEHRISGLPVIDDEKLVGVVTTSDLVGKLCPTFDITKTSTHDADMGRLVVESIGRVESTTLVRDIMTHEVVTVGTADCLHDAADEMYEHRIHRVFVVDEDEKVVGVLTPFDFVRIYANDRLQPTPAKTMDF